MFDYMPEEKVIKGLKVCRYDEMKYTDMSCEECPYAKDGMLWLVDSAKNLYCSDYLKRDVEKMLDRHIPQKPVEASEKHKRLGYMHDCPRCGWALGFKEKRTPAGILPRWMRKNVLYERCQFYCMFCGQAIDWNV